MRARPACGNSWAPRPTRLYGRSGQSSSAQRLCTEDDSGGGERRKGVLKRLWTLWRPFGGWRISSRPNLAAFPVGGALLLLALQPVAAAAPNAQGRTLRLGLVLPDLTNQTINDIYLGAQTRAKELGNVEIL